MQRCVAFAAVLAVCTPSLAAQSEPRKFGLGIGLYPSSSIYIPIALSPRLRLEPTFDFSTSATTVTSGSSTQEQKSTDITLSVGLLVLRDIGSDTKAYIGPRGGLVWARARTLDGSGVETSYLEYTDWFLAVAAGAEHFLSERFSLGGEAQLGYYHAGEPQSSGSGFSFRTTRFTTSAAALVRWYP